MCRAYTRDLSVVFGVIFTWGSIQVHAQGLSLPERQMGFTPPDRTLTPRATVIETLEPAPASAEDRSPHREPRIDVQKFVAIKVPKLVEFVPRKWSAAVQTSGVPTAKGKTTKRIVGVAMIGAGIGLTIAGIKYKTPLQRECDQGSAKACLDATFEQESVTQAAFYASSLALFVVGVLLL